MGLVKVAFLWELLFAGFSVLISDLDVVWLNGHWQRWMTWSHAAAPPVQEASLIALADVLVTTDELGGHTPHALHPLHPLHAPPAPHTPYPPQTTRPTPKGGGRARGRTSTRAWSTSVRAQARWRWCSSGAARCSPARATRTSTRMSTTSRSSTRRHACAVHMPCNAHAMSHVVRHAVRYVVRHVMRHVVRHAVQVVQGRELVGQRLQQWLHTANSSAQALAVANAPGVRRVYQSDTPLQPCLPGDSCAPTHFTFGTLPIRPFTGGHTWFNQNVQSMAGHELPQFEPITVHFTLCAAAHTSN